MADEEIQYRAGPEHYREAERLLHLAGETEDGKVAVSWQRDALVHATLALAAATAYPAVRDYLGQESYVGRTWSDTVS